MNHERLYSNLTKVIKGLNNDQLNELISEVENHERNIINQETKTTVDNTENNTIEDFKRGANI